MIFLLLISSETVGVVISSILVITLWLLFLVHVTEVPCELQVDTRVAPVFLVTPECGAFGVVLKVTSIEYVAPVKCQREKFIKKGLSV